MSSPPRKRSAAVVYVDSKAAFYRVLVEEVIGPAILPAQRRETLRGLGYSDEEAEAFESMLHAAGHAIQTPTH